MKGRRMPKGRHGRQLGLGLLALTTSGAIGRWELCKRLETRPGRSPVTASRCCIEEQKGCPKVTTPAPSFDCEAWLHVSHRKDNMQDAANSQKRSYIERVVCQRLREIAKKMHKPAYVTHDALQDAGRSNWHHGWSDAKKHFCCSKLDCALTSKVSLLNLLLVRVRFLWSSNARSARQFWTQDVSS